MPARGLHNTLVEAGIRVCPRRSTKSASERVALLHKTLCRGASITSVRSKCRTALPTSRILKSVAFGKAVDSQSVKQAFGSMRRTNAGGAPSMASPGTCCICLRAGTNRRCDTLHTESISGAFLPSIPADGNGRIELAHSAVPYANMTMMSSRAWYTWLNRPLCALHSCSRHLSLLGVLTKKQQPRKGGAILARVPTKICFEIEVGLLYRVIKGEVARPFVSGTRSTGFWRFAQRRQYQTETMLFPVPSSQFASHDRFVFRSVSYPLRGRGYEEIPIASTNFLLASVTPKGSQCT